MKHFLHNSLRALFLSLAVLLSLPMLAEEIDGINYNLNAETKQATVIKKSSGKYSGEVVIPESVVYEGNVYSVTSIGVKAFYNCSGLTSVTIGNSVTSIGSSAFDTCKGLTSVTIGNNVTTIGDYAFDHCKGLTSVTIGNSVTSIGDYAFRNCGLTSVSIPNSVTSIGLGAFFCSGLTSVTIGNSVTSIGNYAFYLCTGLTSVTIGNGVKSIGDAAFEGCKGLTSVTIPNSVESIGYSAFSGCKGLTSVIIGNSVTSIWEEAFANCSELLDVYCYAEEAPYAYDNAFEGSYPEYATLHVPDVSIDRYKAPAPWRSFGKIVGLSKEYSLTVSSVGYATLYLDFNAEIPEDVKAYVAREVVDNRLKMQQVEDVLPANTGVIIRAEEGTYTFVESDETPAEIGENLLVGSVVNTMGTAEDNTSYYILAAPDDNVGMYPVDLADGAFVCKANKAYLPISSAPARIYFDFGTETGIVETENGELKTENCYDLAGRKVQGVQKGIYIVGGKKVLR